MGKCVIRIAESVLLTCCPPAPEARKRRGASEPENWNARGNEEEVQRPARLSPRFLLKVERAEHRDREQDEQNQGCGNHGKHGPVIGGLEHPWRSSGRKIRF